MEYENDDEFFTNSNVICLENFYENQANQSQYSKPKIKKGKLYKGANWNAYKRENLGSIPKKFENVLIEEKTTTLKGFNSQCVRFSNQNQNIKYTYPGPGAYNIAKQIIETGPSNSTKGYGNGFISGTNRFDDLKEFQDKYLPGPGQHKCVQSLLHDNIERSLKYQSLFAKSSAKSLVPKSEVPGPGYYLSTDANTITKNQSEGNFYFKSQKERFQEIVLKKFVPGPGKYFKNNDFYVPDRIEKASFFFKKPQQKKENLIEKYIDTNGKMELDYFSEAIKTEATNYTKNIVDTDNSLVEELQNLKTYKTLASTKNKTDFYEIPSTFDKYKNKKNSPIKVEENIIKKEDFYKFKVPGPAYYNPIVPPQKLSFNSKEKKKIWI